jgi:phosphopantetheine adenylyltransferase
VSGNAYKYLCEDGQEYLLNLAKFVEMGKDIAIGILCDEVAKWVEEPYRLLRAYSVHYMHLLFSGWNV